MKRTAWSKEDDAYLIKSYPTTKKQTLVKQLDRRWEAIKIHAQKLGLRRERVKRDKTSRTCANFSYDTQKRFNKLLSMLVWAKVKRPGVSSKMIIDKAFRLISSGRLKIDREA